MTLLERMARAWWEADGGIPSGGNIIDDTIPHMRQLQDGAAEPRDARDRAALAVLREEQAPRWDAPTSDPLTPETMADALATLEDESARRDASHLAAMGIDPRRAHLVFAPPPPCAACGGTERIQVADSEAAYGTRYDPCPDCARGGR